MRIDRPLTVALLAFVLMSPSAYAQVLIYIDVANFGGTTENPASIYLQATAANPAVDVSASNGIALLGVLATDADSQELDLRPGGSYLAPCCGFDEIYDTLAVAPNIEGYPRSIALYNGGAQLPQQTVSFGTDSPAFIYSSSFDPSSSETLNLNLVGSKGDIVSGYLAGETATVIGQWQIIDSSNTVSDTEGARAVCGLYGGPALEPVVSTSDELASCIALQDTLQASADLPNAELKVFTTKSMGDDEEWVGERESAATTADLVTVTAGWDANDRVSGTLQLDVEGALEELGAMEPLVPVNGEFFIALWYSSDPDPRCIYEIYAETPCDGFPFEGPYDYAQVSFTLADGELFSSESFGGTGTVDVQSMDPSDLQAVLSIPWTVSRDDPSFQVAIYAASGQTGLGTADFLNTARGSLSGPSGFQYSAKTGFAQNLPGAKPADSPVDLSGKVQLADGTDLCAMVLASGQYMFSCDPNGDYALQGLPREPDGSVTRQVYADGFFPLVESVKGSTYEIVNLRRASGCPSYNPPYDPDTNSGSAGKRHTISGNVLFEDSATPLCAMVLANGSYVFSCDGSGSYELEFPLDGSGQYTLQVYADGFAPAIQVFDESNTGGDVRMARSSDCQ